LLEHPFLKKAHGVVTLVEEVLMHAMDDPDDEEEDDDEGEVSLFPALI